MISVVSALVGSRMYISISPLFHADDAEIQEDVREETLAQSVVQDLQGINDNENDGYDEMETGLLMPLNIQVNTGVAVMIIDEAQLEVDLQL